MSRFVAFERRRTWHKARQRGRGAGFAGCEKDQLFAGGAGR
jgi:hypothetical protein